MIDTIVKIIDRLIQWKGHRDEQSRSLFDLFVEPTFSDVSAIHNDYLQMFESVRTALTTDSEVSERNRLITARDSLRASRTKYRAHRMQIKTLADAWFRASSEKPHSDHSSIFFRTVHNYFSPILDAFYEDRLRLICRGETYTEMLDKDLTNAIEYFSESNYARVVRRVRFLTEGIEGTFKRICEAYNDAKIGLFR